VVDTVLGPAIVLLGNTSSPNAEAIRNVVTIVTVVVPLWIAALNPVIVLTTVRVYRRAVLEHFVYRPWIWMCV